MNVFLGLTEVSGFFAKLASGLERLGVNALHVPLQSHGFAYVDGANYPFFARLARSAVRMRVEALQRQRTLRARLLMPYVALTRLALFVWVLLKFDVIVLGGGSSFFNFHEFPLFRWLGKKVVYTFHGTDIRPPYIDGFFEPEHYQHLVAVEGAGAGQPTRPMTAAVEVARLRRRRAKTIERNSQLLVCSPNICHFLSKPFISFYRIGLPINVEAVASPAAQTREGNPVPRVVHAPSQRKGKGSDFIRSIMDGLKAEGVAFEYIEVNNMPNAKLLEMLASCDLVIDQAFSDAPVAGLAAEASALGVPVVVGGYYASAWQRYIPAEILPPVVFCRPEEMKDHIARLLRDTALRRSLGERAQAFVTSQWTELEVARRFMQAIDGAPTDWYVDPAAVVYHEGIGLTEAAARDNIQSLLQHHGRAGLQLDDNPVLEQSFADFASR